MSRRRRPPRRGGVKSIEGAESLKIVCSESRTSSHARYRIADVTIYPNPEPTDAIPFLVRVRFIHDDDHGSDAVNPVRGGADPHMTRTFTCRECGRNLPLKDQNLAAIVMTLGNLRVSEIELARLTDAMR